MATDITELSVLIADDHGFMLKAISTCLHNLMITKVYQANHGKEALEYIDSHHIDVVITDLEMGPVNGLELLKKIRLGETKLDKNTPVIVLTGHAERPLVEEAVLLDPSDFAVKPINVTDLKKKLERAMEPEADYLKHDNYQSVETDFTTIIENYKQKAATQIEGEMLNVVDLNDRFDDFGEESVRATAPGEKMVTFKTLKSGMVLSRELNFDDCGEPLQLKKGLEVTKGTIDYLHEFATQHGDRIVFVKDS